VRSPSRIVNDRSLQMNAIKVDQGAWHGILTAATSCAYVAGKP
jgi:hypothetical protein